jgi:hypothetical protein
MLVSKGSTPLARVAPPDDHLTWLELWGSDSFFSASHPSPKNPRAA